MHVKRPAGSVRSSNIRRRGTISSVSYLDSAGTTTVQYPVLPLITYANLKKGTYAIMSAKGIANLGGQIVIYIKADTVQNGESCEN